MHLGAMNFTAFAADAKTHDAVERCLERICEAAYRLGSNAPALMPGHPGPKIGPTLAA